METVEVVLAMLVAVIASGYVARVLPVALPLPLIQIVLGAVISGVFRHGVAHLKPLILRDNAVRLLGLDKDPVFGRYVRLAPPAQGDCC